MNHQTAEQAAKILPCPFCGGLPELILRGNIHTTKRSAEIKCTGCNTLQVVGAIRNNLEWCEQKVIEGWNKRTWQASQLPVLPKKFELISVAEDGSLILRYNPLS